VQSAHIIKTVPIMRSSRVLQLEGLFDVPAAHQSQSAWEIALPLDEKPWLIGLIVGPSGSGKSTIARELFADAVITGFPWSSKNSVVDDFPADLGIKEIALLLSSVGFSSPPAWLRPFQCLSTGEQFRVTIARALSERRSLIVLDEFTSVVDRTVAQIGSAAVAKALRQRQQQFVAVSCHFDIEEWLQPDWIYNPATQTFLWRDLQRRPAINLEISAVSRTAWNIFKNHHYLSAGLNASARCFLGTVNGEFAAFASVLPFPHAIRPGWREHRTVCLPDFQGVGIGNAMSEFIAGMYRATGKPYFSTTGNPAMIQHRARSAKWLLRRLPSRTTSVGRTSSRSTKMLNRTVARLRITAGFEYIGPIYVEEARKFKIL